MTREKIRIGPHNAEETLFLDSRAWQAMPDMRRFRDQWAISRMRPELRQTGRRAILDFLDAAGPDQERVLSEYFGKDVTIDRVNHNAVRNETFGLDDHPPMDGTWDYAGFGCHRDGDTVRITFWR